MGCLIWVWLLFFQWVDGWLQILLVMFGAYLIEVSLRTLYKIFAPPKCEACRKQADKK